MTQREIVIVQRTWKLFRIIKPEIVGDVFYCKLFTRMPALRKLFKSPITDQYKKIIDMLSVIVGRLQNFEEVTEDMRQMAKRHVSYGVKAAHYRVVGDALLWTLEQGLGKDWNEEVNEAWNNCYKMVAHTMLEASRY